jgi:hypothetical protein
MPDWMVFPHPPFFRLTVLEQGAVGGGDLHHRVARTAVELLADHHARLCPRIQRTRDQREGRDLGGEAAVAGKRLVGEVELVGQIPDVVAGRADRVDVSCLDATAAGDPDVEIDESGRSSRGDVGHQGEVLVGSGERRILVHHQGARTDGDRPGSRLGGGQIHHFHVVQAVDAPSGGIVLHPLQCDLAVDSAIRGAAGETVVENRCIQHPRPEHSTAGRGEEQVQIVEQRLLPDSGIRFRARIVPSQCRAEFGGSGGNGHLEGAVGTLCDHLLQHPVGAGEFDRPGRIDASVTGRPIGTDSIDGGERLGLVRGVGIEIRIVLARDRIQPHHVLGGVDQDGSGSGIPHVVRMALAKDPRPMLHHERHQARDMRCGHRGSPIDPVFRGITGGGQGPQGSGRSNLSYAVLLPAEHRLGHVGGYDLDSMGHHVGSDASVPGGADTGKSGLGPGPTIHRPHLDPVLWMGEDGEMAFFKPVLVSHSIVGHCKHVDGTGPQCVVGHQVVESASFRSVLAGIAHDHPREISHIHLVGIGIGREPEHLGPRRDTSPLEGSAPLGLAELAVSEDGARDMGAMHRVQTPGEKGFRQRSTPTDGGGNPQIGMLIVHSPVEHAHNDPLPRVPCPQIPRGGERCEGIQKSRRGGSELEWRHVHRCATDIVERTPLVLAVDAAHHRIGGQRLDSVPRQRAFQCKFPAHRAFEQALARGPGHHVRVRGQGMRDHNSDGVAHRIDRLTGIAAISASLPLLVIGLEFAVPFFGFEHRLEGEELREFAELGQRRRGSTRQFHLIDRHFPVSMRSDHLQPGGIRHFRNPNTLAGPGDQPIAPMGCLGNSRFLSTLHHPFVATEIHLEVLGHRDGSRRGQEQSSHRGSGRSRASLQGIHLHLRVGTRHRTGPGGAPDVAEFGPSRHSRRHGQIPISCKAPDMTMVVDAWDANFGRIHSGDAKSAKKEGAPLQPAGSMDPEIHLEAIFATKDSEGKPSSPCRL